MSGWGWIRGWLIRIKNNRDRRVETLRLEALRGRLLDPRLGPVWWADRFIDRELLEADGAMRVEQIFGAFDVLRDRIASYETSSLSDDQVWIRARLDELFSRLDDPAVMTHVLRLTHALLSAMGAEEAVQTEVAARLDGASPGRANLWIGL
jgi:hypothetical protein